MKKKLMLLSFIFAMLLCAQKTMAQEDTTKMSVDSLEVLLNKVFYNRKPFDISPNIRLTEKDMDELLDSLLIILHEKTDTTNISRDSLKVLLDKMYTYKKTISDSPRFPIAEEDKEKYANVGEQDRPLYDFIRMNLKYPVRAYEMKEQGRVIISYLITSEGELKDIKLEKSVSPSLDKEALRVVSLMPTKGWTPATKEGEAIEMRVSCPFDFRMRNGE